jgi:pantothenate kinase type III
MVVRQNANAKPNTSVGFALTTTPRNDVKGYDITFEDWTEGGVVSATITPETKVKLAADQLLIKLENRSLQFSVLTDQKLTKIASVTATDTSTFVTEMLNEIEAEQQRLVDQNAKRNFNVKKPK